MVLIAGSVFSIHAAVLPTFTGTPVISGTALVGNTLIIIDTEATDADVGDVVVHSYQWLSNTVPISGAITASYTLTSAEAHASITANVTADDSNDGSVTVTTVAVLVANSAPDISGAPAVSVAEDSAYSFTPIASDIDGDALIFSISATPGWASFDSVTGSLSGTPTNSDVGITNNIVITVTDALLAPVSLASFNLQVTNTNDAPVISSSAVTAATEDIAYSYTFTATDVDAGDVLTLSAQVLPTWLSFDTATGVLGGTPSNAEVGSHSVTLRVNDGSVDVEQSFSIIVGNANDVPIISSTAVTAATEDIAYTYTLTATDVDAGDVLTLSAQVLPSWLSFNAATGVLSGTPSNAEVGSHGVTLRVNDGSVDVEQSFSIIVGNINDAPLISSTAVTTATEDIAYTYTFTATDVDAGDVLTLSAQVLPSWLSFNAATGVLGGTPSNAEVGSHSVTLRVNDGSADVEQSFSIIVGNANDVPIISSTAVTAATEDIAYTYTFTATDVDAGDVLTLSAQVLPSWLSFNAATGVLNGTPSNAEVGSHNVTLRVNDGSVDVDQSFSISVSNANDPPVISGTPATTVAENSAYSFTPLASDVDIGDSLIFSIANPPSWVNFNSTTGALSGTPVNSDVGTTNNIIITVLDTALASSSLPVFSLQVVNVNDAPIITSSSVTAAMEDIAYTYTFTATDVDADDSLTLSAPVFPTWLSFDTATGVLGGTPSNAEVGSHSVTLRVNDGTVNVDQSFSIAVSNANDSPVISGIPATTVAENSAYSFTPLASDVDIGDSLIFSIANQPAWASFSAVTGALSGTPSNSDVGTVSGIVITVSDALSASASLPGFALQVTNINDTPTITSTAVTLATEDVAYGYIFVATDIDVDDTLILSAPVLPTWLSFNAATGALSGTPSNAEVGSHSVTLRVNDGTVIIDQSFTIAVANVNDAPVISGVPGTLVAEGSLYNFIPTASDEDVGDSLVFSINISPSWASFSTLTGALTGAPANSDVGSTTGIIITVTDSSSASASLPAFNLQVSNTNNAPSIGGVPATSVVQDSSYSFTPVATDADVGDTLVFSIVNAPIWAVFDSASGALSGVPTNSDVGTTSGIIITVTDGSLAAASLAAFNVQVIDTNDALIITSSAGLVAAEGSLYSYTLTASDIDVGDTLVYTAPVLPGWLSFNAADRLLSGLPGNADVGAHSVILRVSDGSVDVEQSFTITVSDINNPPIISGTPAPTASEGRGYSFTPSTSDSDGDTLIFSIANQPSWLSFNAATGALSGTPAAADIGVTRGIIIRVSDAIATVNLAAFNIIVVDNDFPLVAAPADISIVATGMFTLVDFGEASAIDVVDGVLPVVSDLDKYLPPGAHVVTWSAVDAVGNVGSATQAVNITPLVEFGISQTGAEGNAVEVKVVLNGLAVNYPVAVPFTVSGTATVGLDHNLVDGVITINSGTEALLSFNIIDDGAGDAEENIIITMAAPTHAAMGSRVVHRVNIVESNITPQVVLTADQGQGPTHIITQIITQTDVTVTVTANVIDPDNGDAHSYVWDESSNALVDTDAVASTFSFNPLLVSPGVYTLRVVVSDGVASDAVELSLNVVATAPRLTLADSDGDGIDDATEGYADADNDGVPDYLDAIAVTNVLQGQSGSSTQYLLETEAGLNLALGLVAFQANSSQAVVTAADIVNFANTVEDELPNTGGLFDFIITGLPAPGQSVRVVLPQLAPVPVTAAFRKLTPAGWQDFVEDARNALSSALGDSAYCPPPGDLSYILGLTEGHWCVQLLIEDGGPNDADLRVNKRVVDPGGLVQLQKITVNVNSSGGAIYLLPLLLILWRLWSISYQKKR